MTKFKDMKYVRPDAEGLKSSYCELTKRLREAESYAEAKEVFLEKETLDKHVSTASTLASVRHSIDTRDEFYDEEIDFWDEVGPEFEEYEQAWIDAMLTSPFRRDF